MARTASLLQAASKIAIVDLNAHRIGPRLHSSTHIARDALATTFESFLQSASSDGPHCHKQAISRVLARLGPQSW